MPNFVNSFVGGKDGGTANVGTSLETIKKGDILVVDYNSGAVLTGTGNTVDTSPVIAIAYAVEDGQPILSGPIYGQHLVAGGRNPYTAPVMTKKGFGYTSASTGDALPVETEMTNFSVAVVYPTELRLQPNRQHRDDVTVRSLGGYDLAKKLFQYFNGLSDINPRLYSKQYVTPTVTSDGTDANIGTAATATVVNGDATVTFSAAHGLSAGTFVYFPNSGVYKVASITSTTVIELDSPYMGVSETYVADTVQERADAASFGFTLEAIEQKRTNPVDQYDQVNFEIGLSENFGVSPVTITEYVPGVGTGWQVRDMEIRCMGWTGGTDRRDPMRAEYPFQTKIDKNYLTAEISSIAPVRGSLEQTLDGPQSVFLAFDTTAATQSTAVLAILTPWAESGGIDLS